MLAVLSNRSASLMLLHCFFPKDLCTCMYLFDVMHGLVASTCTDVRESSFNMTRGDEDIEGEGVLRKFLHTRRGALKKLLC